MTGSYTDSEEETFDILSEDQGAIDRNIDAMIQDVEAGQMNNEARVQRLEGVSTSEDEDDSDREQEALASQIRQLKNEFREIRGSVAALQTSALVDGKARMIDDWIEKMLRTQPVDNTAARLGNTIPPIGNNNRLAWDTAMSSKANFRTFLDERGLLGEGFFHHFNDLKRIRLTGASNKDP